MASDVSERLRRQVAERAYHVCEYCLIHEDDSFWGCQVDHIISRKHCGILKSRQGRRKIAHGFKRGLRVKKGQSPVGRRGERKDGHGPVRSFVPDGTQIALPSHQRRHTNLRLTGKPRGGKGRTTPPQAPDPPHTLSRQSGAFRPAPQK